MTPAELTAARTRLSLSAADLGRALQLAGRDPGRYIKAYEKGAHPIPGPVGVAVSLMLQLHAQKTLQEAVQEARDILTPANPPAPVLEALDALDEAAAPMPKPKTRRRG